MRKFLIVALMTLSLCLPACTTPGSSDGAGTSGGNVIPSNIAQNARDQSGAGVSVTTGTVQSHITNEFAAKVDAAVALRAMDLVENLGWNAAEAAAFIGSLVDAPDSVSISGNQSVTAQSGNGEGLGSGKSGDFGGGSLGGTPRVQ